MQPAAEVNASVSSESTVADDGSSSLCKSPRKNNESNINVQSLVTKSIKRSECEAEEDSTPCMYCEVIYCQSSVKWYSCKNCKNWACGQCAGMGRKKVFICDSCK